MTQTCREETQCNTHTPEHQTKAWKSNFKLSNSEYNFYIKNFNVKPSQIKNENGTTQSCTWQIFTAIVKNKYHLRSHLKQQLYVVSISWLIKQMDVNKSHCTGLYWQKEENIGENIWTCLKAKIIQTIPTVVKRKITFRTIHFKHVFISYKI